MNNIKNFVPIDSIYGTFIVNRNCLYQAENLIKTGRTHIEDELNVIFSIINLLPENAVILDGGTNIGFFTIPVAQKVKHNGTKIIGFEPQKMLYYAISGSIALNDLNNCYVYNLGLSDTPSQAQLPAVDYSIPLDYGSISITDQEARTTKNYLDESVVHTITIDELNLPRLDFVKLDIEGHEVQAIKGGIETIKKYRPFVWVEYFIIGMDPIIKCFEGIEGYTFHRMDPQNMVCVPTEKLGNMQVYGY
jgi:FkbM family methyltransferase